MKKYVFDIDGTICTNTYGKYELAKPYTSRIKFINQLFEKGNLIKYFTARGSTTNINWRNLTEKQLSEWGAKYHELIMGKPDGDIFIDDKGFNCNNEILPLPREFEFDNWEIDQSDPIKKDIYLFIELMKVISQDNEIHNMITEAIESIKYSLKEGGKIIFAGNGGSFADAQHLSAEFVVKLSSNRCPLPSIVLGTNSSNITAISNDFTFDDIFSRELEAIGNKKDILFAISTSGNSKNIINLIKKAKELSIKFYVLTGDSGGQLSNLSSNLIKVPSNNTAFIQQAHISIGHIICKQSERDYINL